jgi:PPM family protein phosphatase
LATALLNYTAAAATDRGRKRASNEDAYGLSAAHGIFMVCDGMGGAAAGEVASGIAVEEIMPALKQRPDGEPLPQAAEKAIAAANEAIFTRAQRNPKLSGMGTTLVMLAADAEHAWMLNVGDSRGYRFRGSKLTQITLDHSLVEEQIRAGRMNPSEAQRSPLRNVITRALGTQASVTPDVFALEPEAGDLFLLCSDGLTRELPDERLESMLSIDLPLDELCEQLIGAANKAGGHDNITCVLVRAKG